VPLITTLFHHGAFTANDVFRRASALVAYSIGLLGLILVKVLAPGFYARQNVRTPVRIAHAHPFRHAAAEPAPDRLAGSTPAWRWPSAWPPASTPACSTAACGSAESTPRSPAGCCSTAGWAGHAEHGRRAVVCGRRSRRLAALDLSERLLRLSVVVSFGAGVYFATLWIAGFRLRDFKRSAAE
jgi:putative peptidoglycan lipid II flippase